MDGIHDLGGKHGFGPVQLEKDEEQFHDEWEARARAIVMAMNRAPDWNLDWFRHCRELIDPLDYLGRPYLDQWVQTYGAMLVNSGWATVEELAQGKSLSPPPAQSPLMRAGDVASRPFAKVRFDAPIDAPPQFELGAEVRTVTDVTNGHTRLPGYARNKCGKVISHHGAHVYADDNALKIKRHVHLYTVEFPVAELWPEVEDSIDSVSLDLWETYLEPIE